MPNPYRCGPVAIALLLFLSVPAETQQPARRPVAALTGGLGNTLGGVGGGLEYYVAKSRVSAAVGLGYWPSGVLCPGTFSGAAALRGFTGGRHHRGFLELSYSLVEIACEVVSDEIVENHYGPGISAGYRYTSGGGFTLTAGAGVGDVPGEGNGTELMVLLGVGYTWWGSERSRAVNTAAAGW